MMDLVWVLSALCDRATGRVAVPGFYDDVAPVTPAEMCARRVVRARVRERVSAGGVSDAEPRGRRELYTRIDFDADKYRQNLGVDALSKPDSPSEVLMRRWRHPTLTVHAIQAPAGAAGVICRAVNCNVSMRTVPNQSAERLAQQVRDFVRARFEELRSGNRLEVRVVKAAHWWLGDPAGAFFRAAERAVAEEWGAAPLYIREGGTMPTSHFLQETLRAPVIHIPFGQQSDQAHLENERIRVKNLLKAKAVFKRFLGLVSAVAPAAPAAPAPAAPAAPANAQQSQQM
jgi:di- and tripeptidase